MALETLETLILCVDAAEISEAEILMSFCYLLQFGTGKREASGEQEISI